MRITAIRLATLAGASLLATAAVAQQTAQNETAGDDAIIIVTASKRTATLQDTPISVSVTSAKAIEAANVRDLLDLQTLVPSLRVSQLQSSANTNFIIRGFGNGANNPGIEPSVGVFIDGVYRSRSAAQIGDLPNIDRVEVLRGPQSTLFGKNASAGIISIVTQAPQFEFGGNAEISYGNYNALILRGSITGPISETVAFSLAGNYNRRDGYVRDEALGIDYNDRDRWGVRGSLLFKPSEDFKIRLIGDYDAIDEVCCAVVNIVDGPTGNAVRALGGRIESNSPFALRQFTNYASINDIKNYGVSLQSDARIGAFDLTTILAYRAVDSFTDQDSDFTSADLIGSNFNDTKIDTYTAEVRLASNFDGMFNFLVGGFYFHEDIGINSGLTFGRNFRNYASLLSGGAYTNLEPTLRALLPGTPAGAFGAQGQGRFEDFDYRNRALSLFGQADFAITDRLTVTAGGNYTTDRKDVASNNTTTDVFSGLDLVLAGVRAGVPAQVAANPQFNPFLGLRALQFLPPFLNFPNAVEDGRTRDNNFSYTLRVAYKFSEEISGYATYGTGFKASSFNLSTDSRPFASQFIPGSPAQMPPPAASPIRTAGLAVTNLSTGTRFAGPEDAEVYEVGVKGSFTGFRFNLAGFYQVLRGFQGNVFSGTGFVLANAPQASVKGIELDTVITPVRDFSVTANFTFLDARNDDFPGGSALINGSFQVVPVDLSGQRFAGTPEFSMSVAADYTARFGDDMRALFHVDFFHESPVQIAQGTVPLRREAYALNASATLAFKQGFEVSVWGRNLTDATYLTTIFPGVAQAGTLSGYRNQPRTYGVLARYRF